MKNIVLTGFMGTGKSTVAKLLAGELSIRQIDLDDYIMEKTGMTIPVIFEKYGETGFRDIETDAVYELTRETNIVLSCGGGTVLRDENVAYLKENGRIILLTASPETIYERLKDTNNRPILNGNMNPAYIAGLMEKRKARYESVCDINIATDGRSAADISQEIIKICSN